MLNQSDLPLDNLLGHIICRGIILHGIKLGFRTYMIGSTVQQVALGGADFPDTPVIAADIIGSSKLTILVRGVAVHKLIALVYAINGPG